LEETVLKKDKDITYLSQKTSKLEGEMQSKLSEKDTIIQKLAAQVQQATEANHNEVAALKKEIEELKTRGRSGTAGSIATRPQVAVTSKPIGNASVGNAARPNMSGAAASGGDIPAWKKRQLEREKEDEERRHAEQQAKVSRVLSIKTRSEDEEEVKEVVPVYYHRPDEQKTGIIETASEALPKVSDEELAAQEEARLSRFMSKKLK